MKGNVLRKYALIIFIGTVILSGLVGQVSADMTIYCPETKRPLYIYREEMVSGAVLMASDFEPVDKNVRQPRAADKFNCPICATPLNGWEYWFYKRRLNSPNIVYPAISLLTKEDGKFVWRPDPLNLPEE